MAIVRVGRERVVVVVVVVGLSIVMPTTKQWGKVEVGLGFDNTELFGTSVQTYLESLQKKLENTSYRTRGIPILAN